MSPLDWLRRQPRPLSPQHRARFLEACDAMDASIRAADKPAPVAVVQIDDVVSRTDEAEVRAALTVAPRARREASPACGCWPRYVGTCQCRPTA